MQGSLWTYDADSPYYSELNTGSWWKYTEQSLHRRLQRFRVPHPNKHLLCPVILFIDKTHCDRNGRLNAEPILCSIGNIQVDKRKKPSSWFFLGLLPMQQRSSTEQAAARRGRGLRSIYIRQYHDQHYVKSVIDYMGWGIVTSIHMEQKLNHRTAVIEFKEMTYNLYQLFEHLKIHNQLKLQYAPYEHWWIKPNLISVNCKVPKQQVFTDLPAVISVCLDPDYDSDTE